MSRPSSLASDRPVLLVQLSDSHLFAEEDGKLLGMDTCDSLAKVIERVQTEQPQIDLILASGDLSQDGSLASYQRFRDLSAQLNAPTRWFPGNHDELPAMQQACAGSDLLQPVVDLGHWRIILLDSSIPGAVPEGGMTPCSTSRDRGARGRPSGVAAWAVGFGAGGATISRPVSSASHRAATATMPMITTKRWMRS